MSNFRTGKVGLYKFGTKIDYDKFYSSDNKIPHRRHGQDYKTFFIFWDPLPKLDLVKVSTSVIIQRLII